ncbi:MAG: dihydrodipicolinate synthase family protein [Candidatus Caldarchaeum sp.]
MLDKFAGIVSATLTPSDDFEAKTAKLVDFHLKNRVNGFFVLGTNGEGVKIKPEIRKRIAEAFVNAVGSKGIVIIHTGASDIETVRDLTRHASKIGANAVAAVFPFYYRYDFGSLVNFYRKVVEASSVPVLAYNNPSTQGYVVSPQSVELLLEKVEGLAGIKDSSNDPEHLLSLSRKFSEKMFIASGGDELILYSLAIGVKAQVSAVASVFPDLAIALREAFQSGNISEALKIQHTVNVLKNIVESSGPYHAACKYALRLRGVDIGGPYPPTRELTAEESENLRQSLAQFIR